MNKVFPYTVVKSTNSYIPSVGQLNSPKSVFILKKIKYFYIYFEENIQECV